jgi:hypothetical protein
MHFYTGSLMHFLSGVDTWPAMKPSVSTRDLIHVEKSLPTLRKA